jgi:Protein of unknown function (DUF3515)
VSDRQQGAGLRTDAPPRAVLIAAIAVAVAAIAAVLALAVASRHPTQQRPVVISALQAPQAGSPDCQRLLGALPQQLGDYRRATPVEPVPPGAAAWQKPGADDPVVLRCGLERPADFVVGAPIQVVNGVQWFEVRDAGRSTWFAVDRPVYAALTLPQDSGPMAIQQLSDILTKTLAAQPIQPGPPR